MFRKTVLAIAATAALGVAALAPTSASAQGWDSGWRHRSHGPSFSFGFYGPRHYAYAPRCYTSRRWVETRWGWRLRNVRVCR